MCSCCYASFWVLARLEQINIIIQHLRIILNFDSWFRWIDWYAELIRKSKCVHDLFQCMDRSFMTQHSLQITGLYCHVSDPKRQWAKTKGRWRISRKFTQKSLRLYVDRKMLPSLRVTICNAIQRIYLWMCRKLRPTVTAKRIASKRFCCFVFSISFLFSAFVALARCTYSVDGQCGHIHIICGRSGQ